MIEEYPYTLEFDGHDVIVTNPEKGKFVFKGTSNAGVTIHFSWLDSSYQGKEVKMPDSSFGEPEYEILHSFWSKQRN